MLRSSTAVTLLLSCLLSAAACPAGGQEQKPDDKLAWQEAELKKLQGRWTAFREVKADQEKSRRPRIELEVAGSEIMIRLLDEKASSTWNKSLQVLGVEQVGPVSRLVLGSGEQKKADIYYDFVDDKLILVGRILPRPFEGLSLSGDYMRPDKLK